VRPRFRFRSEEPCAHTCVPSPLRPRHAVKIDKVDGLITTKRKFNTTKNFMSSLEINLVRHYASSLCMKARGGRSKPTYLRFSLEFSQPLLLTNSVIARARAEIDLSQPISESLF